MLTAEDLPATAARLARLLPPFPQVVMRLIEMLEDENASLEALMRLARNDPVIVSAILGTANRIRRMHVQPDLHDPFVAASLIGVNQVQRIVAAAAMNKFIADEQGAAFLLRHSQAVAIVAQELALLCGVSPEKAYVAGILHDIGQLCLLLLDAPKFQDAYRQAGLDGQLIERETAAFGVDHTQLGGALAEHWELPEDFVAAIRTHHDEVVVSSRLQAVVNLAESLTRALDLPPSPKNRLTRLNAAAVAELGIDWHSPEMRDCFGRCRARFRLAVA